MRCTQCGKSAPTDAALCPHCGAMLPLAHATRAVDTPRAHAAHTADPPPALTSATHVRPWVRYFARLVDVYLFAIVLGLGLAVVAPASAPMHADNALLGVALAFTWAFVEALLLSVFGTTPGKWLLRTRIVASDGSRIGYGRALERSIKVWWRGMGTGFPIASVVTMLVAYQRLRANGVTSWDREGRFTVDHGRIGFARVAVVALIFVVTGMLATAARG
ncbi:MAG: hypothetical protein CALGDGBN_02345 [Pseudomonadales bacterium]|nr:hypothetical protein [Pseudomonadales bacterium]